MTWPWNFRPSDNSLYMVSEDRWLAFPRILKRTGRPVFSTEGTVPLSIPNLHYVTVYKRGDSWVCSGHGSIEQTSEESHTSLSSLLSSLTQGERWCIEQIFMDDVALTVARAIQNREAVAVSDGSIKEGFGTAAWAIEGVDSSSRIVRKVVAPGDKQDHSAYRSELAGIFFYYGYGR